MHHPPPSVLQPPPATTSIHGVGLSPRPCPQAAEISLLEVCHGAVLVLLTTPYDVLLLTGVSPFLLCSVPLVPSVGGKIGHPPHDMPTEEFLQELEKWELSRPSQLQPPNRWNPQDLQTATRILVHEEGVANVEMLYQHLFNLDTWSVPAPVSRSIRLALPKLFF